MRTVGRADRKIHCQASARCWILTMVVIETWEDPGPADMVASNLGLKVDITQTSQEIVDPIQRLRQIKAKFREGNRRPRCSKDPGAGQRRDGQDQREYFLLRAVEGHPERTRRVWTNGQKKSLNSRKRIKDAKMPEKVLGN